MPDWTDLQHFIELARLGNLTAAAAVLGCTHATVARRVAALEATIGKRLFHRTSGRYALTADGEELAKRATPMSELAMAVARAADGLTSDLTGPVRVTSTEMIGCHFVVPLLRQLHGEHPLIDLELIIDQRNLSLARRDADIAVRLARPDGGDVIARRVATMSYHVYVSRQLAGMAPEKLPLIGYDDDTLHLPEPRHFGDLLHSGRVLLRTNNPRARLAAVLAGFGAALMPKFIAECEPELQRVDIGLGPLDREIWLLVHSDLKEVARFRTCYEFLADGLRAARHRLRGIA